ncbi:MAG: hypothetical protein ACRD3E_19095, partial [Terriglobales bacterium]
QHGHLGLNLRLLFPKSKSVKEDCGIAELKIAELRTSTVGLSIPQFAIPQFRNRSTIAYLSC